MTDNTTKRCSKCGEEKPLSNEFFPWINMARGVLSSRCKACVCKYAEDRRRARGCQPQKTAIFVIDGIRVKRCSKCEQYKPATKEYFTANKKNSAGLAEMCKQCKHNIDNQYRQRNIEKFKERKRRWREENKEHIRDYANAYKKKHPESKTYVVLNRVQRLIVRKTAQHRRRARKLALPDTWTNEHWLVCLEYWHYCCAVCGAQLRDLFGNVAPNADHWIPLNYEGADNPGTVPGNMICLCSVCNFSKGVKLPEIWLIERYGKRKALQIFDRIKIYFRWIQAQ